MPARTNTPAPVSFTAPYWSTPVFHVGDRPYTWLDVVLFAMAAGEWAAFEDRLRRGLAAAADAERRHAGPDQAEIDAAATAFRYDRDLLTAEETEEWLTRHGLGLDVWLDALARLILLGPGRHEVPTIEAAPLSPPAVDDTTLIAEGVCTGTFARLADMLAARVAVAQERTGPRTRQDDAAELAARHAAWLQDVSDATSRLEHLAGVLQADRDATAGAVTPDALDTQLERARLDWVRVDLESLTLPSREAAREAAWCVREDGLTLSEVAVESRSAIVDERTLLARLDPALREGVLSAAAGELVGPVETAAGFVVAVVVGKVAATLDDPLVRAHAEAAVVDAVRRRAVLAHVRWATNAP